MTLKAIIVFSLAIFIASLHVIFVYFSAAGADLEVVWEIKHTEFSELIHITVESVNN